MTRIFPLVLVILALSASTIAQTRQASADLKTILKRTSEWVETWNNRDVKGMRALHASDTGAQLYGINGSFTTVSKLLRDLESTNFFGLKWAIKIAEPNIRTLGKDSALVAFRLVGKETNSKGVARDFAECFTRVFQRIKRDWKIVHVHDSSKL